MNDDRYVNYAMEAMEPLDTARDIQTPLTPMKGFTLEVFDNNLTQGVLTEEQCKEVMKNLKCRGCCG